MAEGHTGSGGGPSKAPENQRCPVRRLAPSRTAAFLAAEIRSRPRACAALAQAPGDRAAPQRCPPEALPQEATQAAASSAHSRPRPGVPGAQWTRLLSTPPPHRTPPLSALPPVLAPALESAAPPESAPPPRLFWNLGRGRGVGAAHPGQLGGAGAPAARDRWTVRPAVACAPGAGHRRKRSLGRLTG